LAEPKAHAAFLRGVPHHCLQAALVDLQSGFDRFVKGIAGYPKPRHS
jgi:putative transposase